MSSIIFAPSSFYGSYSENMKEKQLNFVTQTEQKYEFASDADIYI